MVDAVSLSANSYRGASSALDMRAPAMAAETRPAVSALAALAAPQPVTQVSTPSDIAGEIGDLSFLYAPNGLPGISALPAYAVPPSQAAADEQVANNSRNPTARLAIESNDLNSLMSSFLTARTPSVNPAASPDVPADAGSEQLARQSVIAQLYSQF
ncbi:MULTISPECIES: hypothetical protein [unclassified Shinella]|uniref:hypothetical protein n=1 Tax=unclassified Shinella TaxID=2643062 RepID=UPI00225C8B9A|nr:MULTISPECIES: hypothetical protein [unclassified Shinella]MCO5136160.1 hypothetical protein [Shinella sp.]MDC7254203.1 hypothetical protein [Shinella sp. YE25]CAI0336879.1 conserved hypothetical protein [Rhizobiaceae bacterium]CAK7255406.1 conserved protein of unknown function [Shinella sp. WSC3-e]